MKGRGTRTPRTPEEWQTAVDHAHALLHLDAAHHYGLITGGPVAAVDRCMELLAQAAERGIEPAPDAVERFVRDYNASVEHHRNGVPLVAAQKGRAH